MSDCWIPMIFKCWISQNFWLTRVFLLPRYCRQMCGCFYLLLIRLFKQLQLNLKEILESLKKDHNQTHRMTLASGLIYIIYHFYTVRLKDSFLLWIFFCFLRFSICKEIFPSHCVLNIYSLWCISVGWLMLRGKRDTSRSLS